MIWIRWGVRAGYRLMTALSKFAFWQSDFVCCYKIWSVFKERNRLLYNCKQTSLEKKEKTSDNINRLSDPTLLVSREGAVSTLLSRLLVRCGTAARPPSLTHWSMFLGFAHVTGLSFLCSQRANKEVLATFSILNRTPGISPTAWPLRPKPATSTSSFSSIKLSPPSRGTYAVILLLFFFSCTLTHLRMAEVGCLASTAIFSTTMPAAWDVHAKGFFQREIAFAFVYVFWAHLYN